jgi:hypothetical protein
MAASATDENCRQRYVWTNPTVTGHEYALAIFATVTERQRWRREYERAKQARAGPVETSSATTPRGVPIASPTRSSGRQSRVSEASREATEGLDGRTVDRTMGWREAADPGTRPEGR